MPGKSRPFSAAECVAALLEIAALAAAQLQRGQGRWRGGLRCGRQ